MSEPKKIFFNTSLPRSGSTLLQNILAQNPRFYCSPTSGLFDLLHHGRDFYSGSPMFLAQDEAEMKKAFLGYCRGALHGYYDALTDRPVCVDKSRGWLHNYEWVDMFYPRPKMLVCVRDLRSILSSLEKIYRKNRHLSDPEDIPARSNMVTVRNRVGHWLNTAPLSVPMMRLFDALERGLDKKVHIIRFEDLTTRPEQTLRRVYEYLEEPQFKHDFDNVEQVTREDDRQHGMYGDHKIRTKVSPVPQDFREVLGENVSNGVRQNYSFFYSRLYPDAK